MLAAVDPLKHIQQWQIFERGVQVQADYGIN